MPLVRLIGASLHPSVAAAGVSTNFTGNYLHLRSNGINRSSGGSPDISNIYQVNFKRDGLDDPGEYPVVIMQLLDTRCCIAAVNAFGKSFTRVAAARSGATTGAGAEIWYCASCPANTSTATVSIRGDVSVFAGNNAKLWSWVVYSDSNNIDITGAASAVNVDPALTGGISVTHDIPVSAEAIAGAIFTTTSVNVASSFTSTENTIYENFTGLNDNLNRFLVGSVSQRPTGYASWNFTAERGLSSYGTEQADDGAAIVAARVSINYTP